MQQYNRYLSYEGRPGPVARVLMAVVAMIVAAASIVLGFFFFVAFLGVAMVFAIVVWFRLRTLRKQMGAATPSSAKGEGPVIEGDFTVIRERQDSQRDGP
ncbi:MAG: hypothetical protein AMJ59_11770 [Gammaproteobacteria bacterium SG8_31]|jgi:hypothetical protein|nr:MAG: hypothetical protein AMJ59_11770 [Gammaproteobacteria bacterium SG8_31]